MSSGLAGIDCHPVSSDDYPSTYELKRAELYKVLRWLTRLR
jgi:hypothetical protein